MRPPRWGWFFGGAAAVVFLALISSGGGDGGPPAPATTQTLATPAAKTPATTAAPAGVVTDGVYEVPADIRSGKYKTPGPDQSDFMPGCYWERAKDSSGSFNSVITNGNTGGPGVVTVKAGEVVTFSGGCTWTHQ